MMEESKKITMIKKDGKYIIKVKSKMFSKQAKTENPLTARSRANEFERLLDIEDKLIKYDMPDSEIQELLKTGKCDTSHGFYTIEKGHLYLRGELIDKETI